MTYGSVSVDSVVTSSGQTLGAGNATSFKNRIINGDQRIDQRNSGTSVTPSGVQYITDRWAAYEDTDGVVTFQQSSTAPPGFSKSIVATTTSADSSLSASQRVIFLQRIEGYNIADLAWGTVNAQTVTLSFWVRSSLTGTFGGSLGNVGGSSRSYPFTYTISAANTFEYKTITIAGDTSGTWDSTNGIGIQVCFGLGVGSTFSGAAGAWAAADYNSATGATSVVGTNGATWYITGVQFEVGSTATSFDYRSYGTELTLCQRYYQVTDIWSNYIYIFGSSIPANYGIKSVQFFTPMRTDATVVAYNEAGTANRFSINRGGAYTAGYIAQSYGFTMTNATGGTISGSEITFSWRASAEL